jgi:stress response protein SCP2
MLSAVEIEKGSRVAVITKGSNFRINADLAWDSGNIGDYYPTDADIFIAATTKNKETYLMTDMSNLVYYANPIGLDDFISLSSDEPIGSKIGPDDVINVFLNNLPENITDVFIGVCLDRKIQSSVSFVNVKNLTLKVKIIDEVTLLPVAEFFANLKGSENGMMIGKFIRSANGWDFMNVNQDVQCTSETPIQEVLEACNIDALA